MRIEVLPYERIRNLRIDNGFTQKHLANYLGISQNTYCQYEIGTLNYPVWVLGRLAVFYNTSVDYLINLTDDLTPPPRAKSEPT